MGNIKILDCTLRDGGYKFDWEIPSEYVLNISSSLINSGIDFIEAGYITDHHLDKKKTTLFNFTDQAEALFKSHKKLSSKILLMFNQGEFSPETLKKSKKSKIISGFRIAFHKKDFKKAIKSALIIKECGYLVFFQPMILSSYSQDQFYNLIHEVYKNIEPDGFYIVDSFGAIITDKLLDYFRILVQNTDNKIILGYHAHNNFQLAFANSIAVIKEIKGRKLMIDSSLMVIGRGAGNLPTELITEYLNNKFNSHYNLLSIYFSIKNSILPLFEKKK